MARKQDIKHLGIRMTPALWTRVNDAAWRARLSLQAYVCRVLEKDAAASERKSA